MGSFIIKNKNSHEEIEVHYDNKGVVDKIEIYSTIWNRDLIIDLEDFSLSNVLLFTRIQEQAFEEFNAAKSEPNPAA